jgi:hypothetical protein
MVLAILVERSAFVWLLKAGSAEPLPGETAVTSVPARLGRIFELAEAGGRRDSNPQQPEPQSGALPLSYGHHR